MSDRGTFLGGFLLGSLFGGVVGGIVGVVITSRLAAESEEQDFSLGDRKASRGMPLSTEESMEVARRGLEDKIAQLNDAIDDVREQLGTVNGLPELEKSRSPVRYD